MNANLAALLYLVAGVLFILSLRGLSSPASSRQGNFLGMAGMAIAVATTLAAHPPASPDRRCGDVDPARDDDRGGGLGARAHRASTRRGEHRLRRGGRGLGAAGTRHAAGVDLGRGRPQRRIALEQRQRRQFPRDDVGGDGHHVPVVEQGRIPASLRQKRCGRVKHRRTARFPERRAPGDAG